MPPSTNGQTKCEIKKVDGKGLGVFASQKIHSGEMILCEEPLFKLTKTYTYISEKISDIETQLAQLTAQNRQLFFNLSDCHRPESPSSLTIYQTNALPLGPASSESGIFPTIARVNHACKPNAHHHWNPAIKCETVYAVVDIEKGDEILISYIDTFIDRASRLQSLKLYFNFDCHCQSCTEPDAVAVKRSDVRRRILGRLETEILSGNEELDSLVDKAEHFYRFLKEEGIYTLSCDTGGPAFTIFQLFLSKRISCGGVSEEDEEGMRRWARLAVDGVRNCRGCFKGVGFGEEEILDYYNSKQ